MLMLLLLPILSGEKIPPSLTQDDLPHPLSPPVPFTCFSHILQGGGKKKKTSTQKMRKFTGKFPKRPKKRIISRFQSFPSNGERRQKGKNRPGRPSSILFLPLFLLVSRSFPLPYQSGGGASFLPLPFLPPPSPQIAKQSGHRAIFQSL